MNVHYILDSHPVSSEAQLRFILKFVSKNFILLKLFKRHWRSVLGKGRIKHLSFIKCIEIEEFLSRWGLIFILGLSRRNDLKYTFVIKTEYKMFI